jgi:hypothetical protein
MKDTFALVFTQRDFKIILFNIQINHIKRRLLVSAQTIVYSILSELHKKIMILPMAKI